MFFLLSHSFLSRFSKAKKAGCIFCLCLSHFLLISSHSSYFTSIIQSCPLNQRQVHLKIYFIHRLGKKSIHDLSFSCSYSLILVSYVHSLRTPYIFGIFFFGFCFDGALEFLKTQPTTTPAAHVSSTFQRCSFLL